MFSAKEILLTKTTFSVRISTELGEEVFLAGDTDILGSWDPVKAIKLERKERCHSNDSILLKSGIDLNKDGHYHIWTVTVPLITSHSFQYKYFTKVDDKIMKWEGFKGNRVINTSGLGMVVDDGIFGKKDKDATDERISIDQGWLSSGQVQLRIFLGPLKDEMFQYISLSDEFLNETKHQIKSRISASSLNYREQEICADQSVAIRASTKDNLSFSVDILHSQSNKLLGRAVITSKELSDMKGTLVRPVLSTSHLREIGEVKIYYLVVTPFEHAQNNLYSSYHSSLWPTLIGHRGMGASHQLSLSQHPTENTLLSFVTAGRLGADFVEFDVQLTKDGIPIIAHDEEIWIQTETKENSKLSLRIPVNKLKYSKIQKLKPLILDEQQEDKPKRRTLPISSRLSRSRSFSEFKGKAANSEVDTLLNPEPLVSVPSVARSDVESNPMYWNSMDAYPSLEHVLKFVPTSVGFNVEIKYPDNEEQEKYFSIMERNNYVDTILRVIFDFAGDRKLIISSFDPDVCLLCSLKQIRFPVFLLTEGGTATTEDTRRNSVINAIDFAKSSRLWGIVTDSTPILQDPNLVKQTHQNGLLLFTYGSQNSSAVNVHKQKEMGVDSVICDNIITVKKRKDSYEKSTNLLRNPYLGKFILHSKEDPHVKTIMSKT